MAARRPWVPDRRDMIWIDCNPQAGREMRDIHPLLVLSPKAFNERTGIVIGLPMSTAAFRESDKRSLTRRGKFRAELLESFCRLMRLLDQPRDIAFLRGLIEREVT